MRAWLRIGNQFIHSRYIEITEEERANIFIAPEFIEFLEQSSKIVQRALSDGYDYIRDYTVGADSGQ